MLSGPEIYRDLQHHASTMRRQVDAAAQELQATERRAQDLVAQRTESVRQLAQHYLPSLDEQSIANAGTEVQSTLRGIQEQQRTEVARLRAAVGELTRTMATQEAEFATTTAQLNACVERRTALERAAAELLQADPEFQTLATEAAHHERELARDEQRAEEMAREAAAKLPAYERSRLFQYLVRRRFGTPEYRAFPLTRSLDRWVANLIGFATAKQGYDFLRVTPPLVAAEVTRRREEFAPVLQRLDDKQAKASDQVGLPAVLGEGARLGAERDRLVAAISQAQQTHRRHSEELAQAESQEGRFYGEALSAFRAVLERSETRSLETRARITPEPRDDALVAEIARLRREEAAQATQLQSLAEQRTATEDRAVGLERLVRRFREANFDAARSRFERLDVSFEVTRYLDGQTSLEDLWDDLRRRQRFEQPIPTIDAGPGYNPAGMSTGTRVLLEAMGHVVGAALRNSAQRGVLRGGFPSGNVGKRSGGGGGGNSGGGGFTRGAGF